ncbi:MAG TPA: FAD binding domain-containing protein [Solirubrobacteraceae bacterium]
MKAPPFEYVRPASVADAVEALAADADARVLAGGQSLVPLLALRLARPSLLVDVGRLPCAEVQGDDDSVRIGALVRHRRLVDDPVVAREAPLLALAARHVGDAAVRNRGTLGGSLAHADPAAELPAALVASRGAVTLESTRGTRELAASDVFEGFFVTGLAPGELLTEVTLPRAGPGTGSAFEEWAPRAADFAVAGIAVSVHLADDGTCSDVGAAACGVGSVPLDLGDALARAGVLGARADDSLWRAVATEVQRACAGDDDRAELAGLLAARAVRLAFVRAASNTRVAA